MISKKFCNVCNLEVDSDDTYCAECGALLTQNEISNSELLSLKKLRETINIIQYNNPDMDEVIKNRFELFIIHCDRILAGNEYFDKNQIYKEAEALLEFDKTRSEIEDNLVNVTKKLQKLSEGPTFIVLSFFVFIVGIMWGLIMMINGSFNFGIIIVIVSVLCMVIVFLRLDKNNDKISILKEEKATLENQLNLHWKEMISK